MANRLSDVVSLTRIQVGTVIDSYTALNALIQEMGDRGLIDIDDQGRITGGFNPELFRDANADITPDQFKQAIQALSQLQRSYSESRPALQAIRV